MEEKVVKAKKTPEQKLEERENKRKLKQKQHMLQYPSDLPDDEYVKPESKQSRSEEVSEDDSEDDPISIIDKFVHVMRTVASKADAEKLAKDIVEEGKKPEHDIDNNDKSKVNETPTNDDGETYK